MSNSIVITNTLVTNWSGVHGALDEVKLATVKSNAGGFTNGDMFFGSNTGIGWLSADGTRSNLNWCILTNSAVTNALLLRGSLCQDQTGTFSNHLIAVTSGGPASPSKGVWRVDGQGHPNLLATIATPHLEGVITLTNDPARWGPWAGKIVTGDETTSLLYTIDTNGVVTPTNSTLLISGGIASEDFDLIPANQDLYCVDQNRSQIQKLSHTFFTNSIGDLLITQSGDGGPGAPKLFIVHWDSTNSGFNVKSIAHPAPLGAFEHVTFAPIDIPPL